MVLGSSQVFAGNQYEFGRAECGCRYLREASVVPEVTLVGEAVADEAELALLDILLDGVEELLLGDLWNLLGFCRCHRGASPTSSFPLVQRGISTTMFRRVFCSLYQQSILRARQKEM
jgi:hypothetical protein